MVSRKVTITLLLFVVVVLAILIPIAILESRRTPDWQASLVEYLDVAKLPSADIHMVWAAEARAVEHFPAEMLVAVPTGWTWEDITALPAPERARCLRLERQRGAVTDRPPRDMYLVVSYHDDGLYHAGWLVHEFRSEVRQEEQKVLLAKLNCNKWEQVSLDKR